jgi:hypothetical protein
MHFQEFINEFLSLSEKYSVLQKKILKEGINPTLKMELRAFEVKTSITIRDFIRKFGFPKEASYGPSFFILFFDVVMMCNNDLVLLKEFHKFLFNSRTVSSPILLAKLEDRILIKSGKNQLFGTQFFVNPDGEVEIFPYDSEMEVDKRRKDIGLSSLAENLQRMKEKYPSGK